MVLETRISEDGVRYTEAQFQEYFDGLDEWHAAARSSSKLSMPRVAAATCVLRASASPPHRFDGDMAARGFGAFAASHGIDIESSGTARGRGRKPGRGRGRGGVLDALIASCSVSAPIANNDAVVDDARSHGQQKLPHKNQPQQQPPQKPQQQPQKTQKQPQNAPHRSPRPEQGSAPQQQPQKPQKQPAPPSAAPGLGLALEMLAERMLAAQLVETEMPISSPPSSSFASTIRPEARGALKAELRKINVSRESYVEPELRECDAQGFMAAGVLLCIWDYNDGLNVLLAKEQRKPGQPPMLNFIGGKRDSLSESARQTAMREAVEETGGLLSQATRRAILTARGPVLWDGGGKYVVFVVETAAADSNLPRRLEERGGPPDPGDASLIGVGWRPLCHMHSEAWRKAAMAEHHQRPLQLLMPHLCKLADCLSRAATKKEAAEAKLAPEKAPYSQKRMETRPPLPISSASSSPRSPVGLNKSSPTNNSDYGLRKGSAQIAEPYLDYDSHDSSEDREYAEGEWADLHEGHSGSD